MAGPLRKALSNWFNETFGDAITDNPWTRFRDRLSTWLNTYAEFQNTVGNLPWNLDITFTINGLWYAITGNENMIIPMQKRIDGTAEGNLSKFVAEQISKIWDNPVSSEIVEILGAVITEPIVTLFEQYAEVENPDPKEFARRFHGIMIGLNLSSGIASTAIEAISAGQIEGAGKFIDQMYWSLGLGFLGWQTLAPLLENGLQPGLRRHYLNLYRPERFPASDLRDLYAVGKITLDQYKQQLRDAGWRDEDLDTWIQFAYRTLPENDVWQLFHTKEIDENEAIRRLRIIGYSPDDIPLLFKLNPPEEVKEVKEFSLSNGKKAYREGLISESEFRSILTALDYSEKEIDIIVQLEDLAREQTSKALSSTQIKAAWNENVITDPEALHWLEVSGFGQTERQLLLDTWKAEAIPVYRKLNLGTITGAYVEGILNRTQAQERLISIGLNPDDAKLELDLTEKRNPAAFGGAIPVNRRYLSTGQLAELVAVGLITSDKMQSNLKEQGYTDEDAKLLTEAAVKALAPAERQISQLTIERSYIARVVDREKANELLLSINLSPENAALVLDTVEAENKTIFSGPATEATKLLTPAILEDLRIGGVITSPQMTDYLTRLNYSPTDIALLVQRAEQLAAPFRFPLSAVQIQRAYLAFVIDRNSALSKLTSIGFTPEDAETLILTTEQENPRAFDPTLAGSLKNPSITVLAIAVQNGILTELEYFARALALGYTQSDANLYLTLATKQERKSIQSLSVSQITAAYDAGLLSWERALTRIVQIGYSTEDAVLILRTKKDLIENTDVYLSLISGDLDAISALSQFTSEGYSDEDILALFASLPAPILEAVGLTLTDLQNILAEIPGGA